MSKLTLYPAYQRSGFVAYALEPLGGRPPAEFQLFTLVEGKLLFNWPDDISDRDSDEERSHKDHAYLFGYTGKVPERVVDRGNDAVLQFVKRGIARRRRKTIQAHTAWTHAMESINLPISVEYSDI